MAATGVAPIDRGVGGLEPGLPLVLEGPAGSGRTVLCLELAAAALERGACVAYVSAEPPAMMVRQAASLGVDLSAPLRSERLALLELDPGAGALVQAHGPDALVEALRAEVPAAELWILDPITALTREIFDERPLQKLVRELFETLPGEAATLVATADREMLDEEPAAERALRNLCGAFLTLDRDPGGVCTLRVAKSRGPSPGDGDVLFRIGSDGSQLVAAAAAPAPVAASQPASAPLAAATPAPAPREREKILVVEDERSEREELEQWLSERWDVCTAADGVTALTRVLAERPDLIVLDLQMARISGRELIHSMRQGGVDVPLLAVSAPAARSSDRIGALVLGATDVVVKPLRRFELVHRVESLLRLPPNTNAASSGDHHLLAPLNARQSRSVPRELFEQRLERAVRFGEECGLGSSVAFLEAPDETAFDELVAAADDSLRAEDAVLAIDERHAAALLVATGIDDAPRAVARLAERYAAHRGERPAGLAWSAASADDVLGADREGGWKSFCQELQPWPPRPCS